MASMEKKYWCWSVGFYGSQQIWIYSFYRAHILVEKDKGWIHNQQFNVKKMTIFFLKVSMTISNSHYDISMTSSHRWKHGSQKGVQVHQERFWPVFAASESVLSQITLILLEYISLNTVIIHAVWTIAQSDVLFCLSHAIHAIMRL